jgi:amino acid adenylation domain-containing protein
MSDVFNRMADLSQQKRELLTRLLRERGFDLSRLPIIPRAGDRSTAELSFAQQRLWFLSQLEPGNPFYNVPTIVRLKGLLDTAAFQRALNSIVQRHEALRTVFPIRDGRPLQVILPALTIALPIVDIPGAPRDVIRQLAGAEIQQAFDLGQGPLLRARLLRLSDADYVLILTMHHIVSDGWSMNIFIRELAALYDAFIAGRQPALAALPIQYADYAVWQRQWLQGAVLAAQLAYWRQQLAELPTLNLPTDHSRPPVQTFRGARQPFVLPPALSADLTALAQSDGATLFMLLLAAFQTLLARHSRQRDIVIGSPIAGRHQLEIEGLIGCFINTLVLRTDLSGNPPFRELLGRVRQICMGAYAHQDLPFEKLVEELQPTRDLSRQPLFQTLFILQDDSLAAQELPQLTLYPLVLDNGTAQFDLTLSMVDSAEGLVSVLEYNSDLFEAETIMRMAGHLQTLLAGVVADPARRLSELPLLTAPERQQLLVTWNGPHVDYPPDLCLHTLIERQAARTPDAVAVVFDFRDTEPTGRTANAGSALSVRHLTYAELDARANQLAQHLRALGVGPEVRVGVCLERSLELLVGLLGVLKAGGAYVPLDPDYPPARLAFMLEDTQAAVLLVATTDDGRWTMDDLGESSATIVNRKSKIVHLDADWSEISRRPATPPPSTASAANPAYVIYTSGSTGQPKGALNTHGAIVNRLLWMQDAYRLTAADHVLQKTPFSFDVSVWEFFWPLLNGARLVVARPQGHKDPAYLAQVIAAQQITTLHFVPSMLRLFLDQPGLDACRSLRRVICSGEALPAEVQERFFARLDAELYNLYGPTEAAVDVTAWACERGDSLDSVPIGRPIANTQIAILDTDLQPVPIGVPGELFIGGVQLARGYLNRADLTAERFVPNPFLEMKDERRKTKDDSATEDQPFVLRPSSFVRLYKTGDLARYRPDGVIEFLGRLDQQIKIRGFRVEPSEIAATLCEHPGVRAAAVVGREQAGDKRLVAYVVSTEERRTTEDEEAAASFVTELRTFLHAKLPGYMVPAMFVLLDALPLSPNGKLDLRALPDPDGARPAPEATYVAPRTDVEQQIAAIWQAVLGIDRVGVDDNFFDLGGHSLLLIQVHSQLCELLDQSLSVVELFQYPTISALVRHIYQEQPEQPAAQQAQQRADTRLDTMQQQRQFRQKLRAKKPSR